MSMHKDEAEPESQLKRTKRSSWNWITSYFLKIIYVYLLMKYIKQQDLYNDFSTTANEIKDNLQYIDKIRHVILQTIRPKQSRRIKPT